MTSVCLHPNERFYLHRISYLSIHSSRRRSTFLCFQSGIAVERCAVRRIHNGFRLPVPYSYFHEWKIRSPKAAQSESTVSLDENSGGGETDNVEISLDGDVYRSTLRLVECAMFAAVTGLVYYLSNSLAIENYFGCFFSLPIVISSMRWGLAAGRKTMVATAMLLLTLSGPLKACTYLLMHGILGLAMGSLWRLGANWMLSITLCTLVRATGALGYVLLSSFLLRENILSLIAINLHASLSYMLAALGVNVIPSMKTIYTIFGTLLLLNCGFFVFLLHMLYAVFISRLGMRFSLVLPGWLEKAL
ncbi:uncharacterized protein LOC116249802 [Nymphaea colorata]|nr:uncharacterized protein LOC116249802 [Nymphaea colorata]